MRFHIWVEYLIAEIKTLDFKGGYFGFADTGIPLEASFEMQLQSWQ